MINRNKVTNMLIGIMFFSLALDMGGGFGLRNVLLPICMLLYVMLSDILVPKNWLIPFALLVVYPTVSLIIGIVGGAEIAVAISQYQSTVLAFMLFIILFRAPYKVTMDLLINSLFVVAIIAIILAVGLVLRIDSISDIVWFIADKKGGYFGDRAVDIESIIPNVYFKSTLFFVPAFIYSLFTKRYLFATVFFAALIVAVSKTGMVITTLIAIFYLLRFGNKKELIMGGLVLISSLVLIAQSPLLTFFIEVINNDSETVNVRAGHLQSLVYLWSESPNNFIFGFGLGSTFFSSGTQEVVSNIEIDHFNTVRKYGILWSLLFFFWVLKESYTSIGSSSSKIKNFGWGTLIAFFVAGTNPILISPIFFLFLFITMAANVQSSKSV